MYSFSGIARPQSQFIHSCICEGFIYSQDLSTYFPPAKQADRSWKYINLSQIYECRILETEHYNSVLEITVSFMVIHKWEPCRHLYWIVTRPSFTVQATSPLNNAKPYPFLGNISSTLMALFHPHWALSHPKLKAASHPQRLKDKIDKIERRRKGRI